jgi:hypothetical protein
MTPPPSASELPAATTEKARPPSPAGSSWSSAQPSPMKRLMPSSMLLPSPSEHCPQTARRKTGWSSTRMRSPLVRASVSLGISPVVSVSDAVSARFHSSTAWRYTRYVVEKSRPLSTLSCSIRLWPVGSVQMVGASRPNAACVGVGTFVRQVIRALEGESATTCVSLIESGSSGTGGVSVLARVCSGIAAPLSRAGPGASLSPGRARTSFARLRAV